MKIKYIEIFGILKRQSDLSLIRCITGIMIVAAICMNLCFQFIHPAFNVDEVSLGFAVQRKSWMELCYPMDNLTSAPPFFLWILKAISLSPIPYWIGFKLFGWIVASLILILARRFALTYYTDKWAIVFFVLFMVLNPYVNYHSSLLKQYGLDLLLMLGFLLLIEWKKIRYMLFIYCFFWSFISNSAIFGCLGYWIFNVLLEIRKANFKFRDFYMILLRKSGPVLALFPYGLYAWWFSSTSGANELMQFMHVFWKDNFIPVNSGIFPFLVNQIHGASVFFFSSYESIGFTAILLVIYGLIILNKLGTSYQRKIIGIGLTVMIVYAIVNVFKYYPFSERHYFFLTIWMLIFLIQPIQFIKHLGARRLLIGFYFLVAVMYLTYLPYKENNVSDLLDHLQELNIREVKCSDRAILDIRNYLSFIRKQNILSTDLKQLSTIKKIGTSVLVSRVHHKFGYKEKTAAEEPEFMKLLQKSSLIKLFEVEGYRVYIYYSNGMSN